MSARPTAAELLERPDALLTRTALAELGLGRAAIDAVFRELQRCCRVPRPRAGR